MELILCLLGGMIAGGMIAAAVSYYLCRNNKRHAVENALLEKQTEMELLRKEGGYRQQQIEQLQNEKNATEEERRALQDRCSSLEKEAYYWKTSSENATKMLEENEKRYEREKEEARQNRDRYEQKQLELLSEKFETTSQRLLKERSEALGDANKQSVGSLLDPIQKEIESVRKLMTETRSSNEQSNASLRGAIESIVNQTQQLGKDANNLADALKNRGKVHGDWGEQVLDDILQGSGLREGIEYSRQESFSGEKNSQLRPDVVVNCADGKRIIIDSKVSLKDYTEALGAANDEERQNSIRKNFESVKKHIKELSEKNYPKYVPNSMKYVLMFIPNEGSYIMAMNHDHSLGQEAFRAGVIIVNPTNLMMSLHLVLQTWHNTRQEDNCKKILDAASALYDKIVTVSDTYDTLGKQLQTAISTYQRGKVQLNDGQGNVLRRVEKLKEFGISSTKKAKLRTVDGLEQEEAVSVIDTAQEE